MEALTLKQVLEAVHGRLIGAVRPEEVTVTSVCTDCRKLEKDCLYFSLGAEKNGADVEAAVREGASGCVTGAEVEQPLPGKFYIRVPDAQAALLELAAFYRGRFDLPLVAVTGAADTADAVDMLAAVLGEKYRVLKTAGVSDSAGLLTTLLRLRSDHQAAVLEMRGTALEELADLSRMLCADVTVVTSAGEGHADNLDALFAGMKQEGAVVLNGDDSLLRSLGQSLSREVIWCGEGESCAWRVTDLEEHWQDHIECVLHTPTAAWKQKVPGMGSHMACPCAMAAAVGRRFGLTDDQIRRGILEFEPTRMCMNILHRGQGVTILDDAHNANPQSMRAALEILSKQPCEYRIAVLGDMLELGELGPALHESVGQFLGRTDIDCLVTVGKLADGIACGAERSGELDIHRCANQAEAQIVLAKSVRPNSTILVKAGSEMKFEHIVDFLVELLPECET